MRDLWVRAPIPAPLWLEGATSMTASSVTACRAASLGCLTFRRMRSGAQGSCGHLRARQRIAARGRIQDEVNKSSGRVCRRSVQLVHCTRCINVLAAEGSCGGCERGKLMSPMPISDISTVRAESGLASTASGKPIPIDKEPPPLTLVRASSSHNIRSAPSWPTRIRPTSGGGSSSGSGGAPGKF